jgi:segregation and condensation protein B
MTDTQRNDGADIGNDSDADAKHRMNRMPKPEYVDFDVEDFPGGLPSCLEAILMVASAPQHAEDLARILAVDVDLVEKTLLELHDEYEGDEERGIAARGYELRHTARGWQFVSRAVFEPVVSAFVTDGQSARLSQAALEALSIIAYKQPVTRGQIAAIRGVNSDGVVRSLSIRGLIRENGVDPDSRAGLLVTTPLFLENMGLDSIDQLPSLAPFLPSEQSAISEVQHGGVQQGKAAQQDGTQPGRMQGEV